MTELTSIRGEKMVNNDCRKYVANDMRTLDITNCHF